MNKVINSASHKNSLQKEVFNQFTKCGYVYVGDDSSDAFLLCYFCTSTSEDRILRTIEEFIDHIKWHRSDDDPSAALEPAATESEQEMLLHPEGDPIDVKQDPEPESTVHECEGDDDNILSHIQDECLGKIIDLFKKCPCLWHSATAEGEKKYIDPAKCMVTKYFNKLTKRTESVEYVEEFLEKIKRAFLENFTDEGDTTNQCLDELNFLLTSEMRTLDQSIYTDFRCTICDQKLQYWEFLWDHLCECHMEFEDNDLSSLDFNDDAESEFEETNSATQEKSTVDSDEYIAEFIETYNNHPRLWNKNHHQYTNRRLREKSYTALMDVMKKYDDDATHHKVLAKIRCYRTQFSYAYRKICEAKDRNCVYTPHIWYYDKLLFLEGKIQDRRKPNICSQPDESQNQRRPPKNNEIMSRTCTACNKKFPSLTECLDHMQIFHDSSAFQSADGFFYCPICNYQNKTKYSLIRHLRHTHSSSFKVCDDCGMEFRFMSAWVKHKAKKHNDFRPFKCADCGKGFGNLCRMKIHSVIHLNTEDRPHACEICGSKFSNRANLVVHVRRHTKNFRIACQVCGKSLATTSELRSHMLTHTKVYPCICDVCGKGFRNNRAVKIHQEEYHGAETYPCDFCDKKFKSRPKLLYHHESHKKVADNECEICGKKFIRIGSLRNHLRRKHKRSIKKILLDNNKQEYDYLME